MNQLEVKAHGLSYRVAIHRYSQEIFVLENTKVNELQTALTRNREVCDLEIFVLVAYTPSFA